MIVTGRKIDGYKLGVGREGWIDVGIAGDGVGGGWVDERVSGGGEEQGGENGYGSHIIVV